jgi:sec-independent protein translocase protein TatA
MFGLGATELIVVAVIVVVMFGGKKLPELGKGIGAAIKNFKKSVTPSEEIELNSTSKAGKE